MEDGLVALTVERRLGRQPVNRDGLTLVALDADEMEALRGFWDSRARARRLFGTEACAT